MSSWSSPPVSLYLDDHHRGHHHNHHNYQPSHPQTAATPQSNPNEGEIHFEAQAITLLQTIPRRRPSSAYGQLGQLEDSEQTHITYTSGFTLVRPTSDLFIQTVWLCRAEPVPRSVACCSQIPIAYHIIPSLSRPRPDPSPRWFQTPSNSHGALDLFSSSPPSIRLEVQTLITIFRRRPHHKLSSTTTTTQDTVQTPKTRPESSFQIRVTLSKASSFRLNTLCTPL